MASRPDLASPGFDWHNNAFVAVEPIDKRPSNADQFVSLARKRALPAARWSDVGASCRMLLALAVLTAGLWSISVPDHGDSQGPVATSSTARPVAVSAPVVEASSARAAPAPALTSLGVVAAIGPASGGDAGSTTTGPSLDGAAKSVESDGPPMTMEMFLDRLMLAESGGRLDARNPRSTAVGPYQFIESTFIAVVRRHFAGETASLTTQQILALRTDPKFSRRAAEAYTRDNAAILSGNGVAPTYPHLRLAFLLGPGGASRVLKAPPEAALASLLAPAVLVANPFMASLTARGLAARAAREVLQPVTTTQGVQVAAGAVGARRAGLSGLAVRCNLKLPSCRRWVALHQGKSHTAARKGARTVAANRGVLPPPSRLGGVRATPKR